MTRAADIIEALNGRAGARVPRERRTGLPYGWALWIKARAAAVRAPAPHPEQVLALLATRPPRAPQPGEELNHWQALLALFRQGWLPPPPEERPLRALSWGGSIALHLLFVALLAWIAYLQLLPPPAPEAGGGGGGARIGIGFVPRDGDGESVPGNGAPQEPVQAGSPSALRGTPAAETAAQEPSPSREVTVPQVAVAPVEVKVPDGPEPALPELQVGEVPVPPEPQSEQAVEVLTPPVAPVPVPGAQVAVRPAELQVREREVPVVQAPVIVAPRPRVVDVPLPQAVEPELRPREVAVVEVPAIQAPPLREVQPPVASVRLPELRQREIGEPLPPVGRAAPAAAVPVPVVDPRPAAAPALRQREIAMPAPAQPATSALPTAAGAAPAPAAATATTTTLDSTPGNPAGTAVSGSRAISPGAAGAAAAAADNAAPASAPGADPWARALADDRWGPAGETGARAPGLFDGDGRARLPGTGEGAGQGPGQGPGNGAGDGLADRGAPGGQNDAWSRERIEQSGTWLKRPPYDYEPTSFDRYWVPNQSLLAEWVRKGIQSVAIPIPGSNGKKLNCVISLLQLGGGCGISDDNLNEQPAVARPPPDIPFKPELQEDNGSVAR